MNESETIKEKIFEFVVNSSLADSTKLNGSTLLFAEGYFDSMAFVLLIDFIEEKFQIKPDDNDLIEDNFESIDAITNYISKKKGLLVN